MKFKVNDRVLSYEAAGVRMIGPAKVLLHEATDLSEGKAWATRGFTIEKLFDDAYYEEFTRKTRDLIRSLWKKSGLSFENDFSLEDYHEKASTFEAHSRAIDSTKLLATSDFPIPIEKIENRISEICQHDLRALNPFDGQSVFHFRVIRPESLDNNPLHRDVWLEDYSDCINLYIPVAGSNERSSLILLPESHHWPESDIERTVNGAVIKGIRFNVPGVTDIRRKFTAERPDPGPNEVLVFSPYLIHGGSVNETKDKTRISIELRLWKKT